MTRHLGVAQVAMIEKIIDLGYQLDNRLSDHTDGDNVGDNHGSGATYLEALHYIYDSSTLIRVIPLLHALNLQSMLCTK